MPRRQSVYLDEFAHANPIPAACRVGDVVMSGIITGRDAATGRPAATLDEQCSLVFQNLRAVVEAAGAGLDDVVKVTVWLADRSDREALNREWLAMFPDPADRPARQAHPAELGGGVLIACDVTAVLPPTTGRDGGRP